MTLPQKFSTFVAALLLGCCLSPNFVFADRPDDVQALTAALDNLDSWIGDGQNGDQWRNYLRSAELREQIAAGHDADPAVVARVLLQYRSSAAGLDKPRFVAVRRELQDWLSALRAEHADNLPQLARAARDDFLPLNDTSFAVVRDDLQAAATRLQNRLGVGTAYADGWYTYLQWPLLEPHLSNDFKITGQSLRDLDTVLRRLRTNQPGLEHPVFVNLANSIERYRELAFWYALAQRTDTRPRYENFVAELEKQLTRNLELPTVEAARQIGKITGLIHHLGYSPWLVEQIHARFDQPNVMVEVSTPTLRRMATRPVGETTPVRDWILGARVIGTAHSTGVLDLQTAQSANHIAIDLQLAGNIQSYTNSYKKPVRVTSRGSTNFTATKHVQISDDRFYLLPAAVSARTSTRIQKIKKTGGRFGHRLIERIAHKKAAESKPQAEYIGARHAERRIAAKFDRQVIEALHEARDNYDQKIHPPLERIGMFPDPLHMASTTGGVQIEARFATHKQISTDRPPPARVTGNDFNLQIHESALNNYLPHLLGGAKLSQDSETEAPQLEGNVPAWLRKAMKDPEVTQRLTAKQTTPALHGAQGEEQAAPRSEFRPWSFLFNNEHPVSISLDDQKLTLRIRIAELTTLEDGEESVRKNWDFLVTYEVVQHDNSVVLRRVGKIEALPTGFDPVWFGDPRWDEKLTSKQVGIRKNLEENINKRADEGGAFPPEIPLPPVKLPTNSGVRQELILQQCDCDDGWLSLGYRMP